MRIAERWETRAALGVVAAAGVLLVGVVLLAWLVLRANDTRPVPWDKPANVDGSVLHLTYLGSECRDGASVDVVEDSDQVTLTVEETVHARSCSDVGVIYDLEVRLSAPLGERELVDGACLSDEYDRRPACRDS